MTSGRLEIGRPVFVATSASTNEASKQSDERRIEMGRIVISTNVSLDGVVQDPDGKEGFRHGGWFGQFGGDDLEEWAKIMLVEAQRAEALLLGRRSDEWFAARWASRSGEWADRLNGLPKYVVSSSIEEPRWANSTVLKGNVVDAVSNLKRDLAGVIVGCVG